MKVSPARSAAFDALLQIDKESAFSSVVLPHLINDLTQKDKALAHEIVLGVLRRRFYLDRVIDTFATNKKLDIEVRLALRIGIFQLLFLDRVPDYSVLNESVNLVQRAKKTSAKGFVNAVLRRVIRDQISFDYADELERISVETSHPRWLIEKWAKDWGIERAESLAAASNIPPVMAFRSTNRGLKQGLSKSPNWQKSEIVEGCFFADRMDDTLLKLVESGDTYFQDEASQLIASAVKLDNGARFLDVCAAPGGKTTLISTRANSENLIVAGDLPWPRVELMHSNCRKQETEVSVVQYNAESDLPFAEASFDAVFVDAPCTGTGTIRHNPEIRYTVKPSDFEALSNKQLSILAGASKLVKPGGRLYYSTCSLEPEENEEVISRFVKQDVNNFTVVSSRIADRFVTNEGFVRTFPDRDGMDGFFLAVLQRECVEDAA